MRIALTEIKASHRNSYSTIPNSRGEGYLASDKPICGLYDKVPVDSRILEYFELSFLYSDETFSGNFRFQEVSSVKFHNYFIFGIS